MADAQVSKTCELYVRVSSTLTSGTRRIFTPNFDLDDENLRLGYTE